MNRLKHFLGMAYCVQHSNFDTYPNPFTLCRGQYYVYQLHDFMLWIQKQKQLLIPDSNKYDYLWERVHVFQWQETEVNPLLMHWSYHSLMLSHRFEFFRKSQDYWHWNLLLLNLCIKFSGVYMNDQGPISQRVYELIIQILLKKNKKVAHICKN